MRPYCLYGCPLAGQMPRDLYKQILLFPESHVLLLAEDSRSRPFVYVTNPVVSGEGPTMQPVNTLRNIPQTIMSGDLSTQFKQDAAAVQRVKHANTIRLQYDQAAVDKVRMISRCLSTLNICLCCLVKTPPHATHTYTGWVFVLARCRQPDCSVAASHARCEGWTREQVDAHDCYKHIHYTNTGTYTCSTALRARNGTARLARRPRHMAPRLSSQQPRHKQSHRLGQVN